MSMSATAFRITDLRDLDAAFTIREKVFVEGQGVPATLENDLHDRTDARHYLARTADGTPAGAARWRETDHGVKLERFAVLEDFRNQEVGAAHFARRASRRSRRNCPMPRCTSMPNFGPCRFMSGTGSGKKASCLRKPAFSITKWCYSSAGRWLISW